MPQSETAKKVTKTIKAIDKLLADMYKNWKKVSEAVKELKEDNKEK